MKNKRGFLLAEETLKIIIAVISITFLVYFLGALYFSNKTSQDLELAKSSLKHLVDGINSGNTEVDIYNPKGWSLVSWPYEGQIPDSCKNNGWTDCLCICNTPFIPTSGNFKDNCQNTEKSFCLNNNKKLVVEQDGSQIPIKISSPPITLKIEDNIISIK